MIYKNIEKHGFFVIQIPPAPPCNNPHPTGWGLFFYKKANGMNYAYWEIILHVYVLLIYNRNICSCVLNKLMILFSMVGE